MKIAHAVIAVPPDTPDDGPFPIIHFVGFEKPPQASDITALYTELRTDPEFEMEGVDFKLMIAPEAVWRGLLEMEGLTDTMEESDEA